MSLTDNATSVQMPNEDNGEDMLPQVSSKAVIQALAQVRDFIMQQGESTASKKALQEVIAMENWVQELATVAKKTKQTTIDSFSNAFPTKPFINESK